MWTFFQFVFQNNKKNSIYVKNWFPVYGISAAHNSLNSRVKVFYRRFNQERDRSIDRSIPINIPKIQTHTCVLLSTSHMTRPNGKYTHHQINRIQSIWGPLNNWCANNANRVWSTENQKKTKHIHFNCLDIGRRSLWLAIHHHHHHTHTHRLSTPVWTYTHCVLAHLSLSFSQSVSQCMFIRLIFLKAKPQLL